MDHLSIIYNSFEEIKEAKGRSKLPLVKIAFEHPVIAQALLALLNPRIVLNVGEKSLLTPVDKPPSRHFDDFWKVFSFLGASETVNDQVLADVQHYIQGISDPDVRHFAVSFLSKTYTLGLTAKTLNKALGYEAIPLMECMLANKFFDHPKEVEGQSFTITEKLDGIRCIAFVEPDFTGALRAKLYSRQGQPITGLKDIEKELRHLASCYGVSIVFDGELLVSERWRYPSTEQYKRTTQIVRTKDEYKTGITYHVFDLLSAEAFHQKACETPYCLRRDQLNTLFAAVDDCQHVEAVPVLYSGSDVNMIYQHLESQRRLQHEGVMINLDNAAYVFGRTSSLLKVKVMQDCDLAIVGYEEGSGKFSGTLGALIVDYKGTRVGVGSGLSDQARRFFWDHQQECLGRIVTIQYFEETHDANGFPSLRFPVFKEMREEGKEISYS